MCNRDFIYFSSNYDSCFVQCGVAECVTHIQDTRTNSPMTSICGTSTHKCLSKVVRDTSHAVAHCPDIYIHLMEVIFLFGVILCHSFLFDFSPNLSMFFTSPQTSKVFSPDFLCLLINKKQTSASWTRETKGPLEID